MRTTLCSGSDLPALLARLDAALAGWQPTLAVVFSSVAIEFPVVARHLHERGLAVAGVTTAGEIAGDAVIEQGCSILLLDAARDAFAVEFQAAADDRPLVALARQLGTDARARFARPIVVAFAAGLRADGDAIVRGFRETAGGDVPLYGGMAGDDLRMQATHVFTGERRASDGLVGLVLDGDRFEVAGSTINGWQAVGVEKTVTRSEANIVYTIDGVPALDVYRTYLNIEHDRSGPPDGSDIVALGVQYPLSVRRSNGTSVIRAPLFYQPESDALIFAGSVPEGARVKFCIPPSVDIVDRVLDDVGALHARMPGADAVLLVACKARHLALGPLALDEVRGINGLWDAPMAGYFSYGEIGGPEPQLCDFHTESCTLIALRAR